MLDRLDQIGFVFKKFREQSAMTQDELAEKCGSSVSRTAIALLEQGRRTPSPTALEILAKELKIPGDIWQPFAREESSQRHEFEGALRELVGQPATLKLMHVESVHAAEQSIKDLFSANLTHSQAYDSLKSVLVYYGVPTMSRAFFIRYFQSSAFQSTTAFAKAVHEYQKEAIRLFSTFRQAYDRMNAGERLDELLRPLAPRDISSYSERTVWERSDGKSGRDRIAKIEEERLPYLGYISVAEYKKQRQKREVLARYLRELAGKVRQDGALAVEGLSDKRRRKMDSLLRELDSTLQHTPISPLFSPNPEELEAEAARILRDEQDEQEMERTQSEALTNLSNYVSAEYMDVYVATSMRTESDFISVNRFVTQLFQHDDISPLRLRYFNPTQSWIEDRVAKGLVEALMLKRADYTIYMAQKSDTFGKDSEASVALGQGKPVIVYVPKLSFPVGGIDSERLHQQSESALKQIISRGASHAEIDETLDKNALFAEALTTQLRGLTDAHLTRLVRTHWADFGLLDESERIRGKNETSRREQYSTWIKKVRHDEATATPLPPAVRQDLLQNLVAIAVRFESRARVFREVHPLALQVILSTGVLNGILVTRSVNSCALLLRGLIENRLQLELRLDDPDNYRLVEVSTNSTIRVISRNNLLVNAFDAFYATRTNM